MSIGFRPTAEDNEIIQAHKRPDESTSDVLRRALRALERERWTKQAREDMERIAASGEDLSDEPDDWGYDEDGRLEAYQREQQETPKAADARVQAFELLKALTDRAEFVARFQAAKPFPEAPLYVPVIRHDNPRVSETEFCALEEGFTDLVATRPSYRIVPASFDHGVSDQRSDEGRAHHTAKLARLHAAARRRAGKR